VDQGRRAAVRHPRYRGSQSSPRRSEARGISDADDREPHGAAPGSDKQLDLAELIRYLAVNLVDKPDEVRVELVEERAANVYELEVAESDLGKIIGRGGKTARALRTVVQQVAPRSRKRTLVEILE
jgi:predicted RNA-binding protein YlqC (UPF0109 family)